MAKDLFSEQSGMYAKYRPSYPPALIEHIVSFTNKKDKAWDCATGNGQAAVLLADFFSKVEASDISEAQIRNAIQRPDIEYHICAAEQTPFADNSFDLITVAQAYHWLNWNGFHLEAKRVGKPGAVVAVWGYNLPDFTDARLTRLLENFYKHTVGPYWDPERRYVDEGYQTVPFYFDPLPVKDFSMQLAWTKEQFLGYLQSWSSVRHFTKQKNFSPLVLIEKELDSIWQENETKNLRFPLFMRLGRIKK